MVWGGLRWFGVVLGGLRYFDGAVTGVIFQCSYLINRLSRKYFN